MKPGVKPRPFSGHMSTDYEVLPVVAGVPYINPPRTVDNGELDG